MEQIEAQAMVFFDTAKEARAHASCWGHEHFVLTESDIQKLKQGKILLIDVNNEYTVSIVFEKGE